MIRARENPLALKAGVFSVLVHGLFFVLLVMTFSWKNVPTMQVAQVELWDSLPQPKVAMPEPPPPQPPPKIEPEPAPPPEPKAEIQIKAKPPVPEAKKPPREKPKAEPRPDPALKVAEEAKKRAEDLKRLQQLLAQDDQQLQNEAQQHETKNAAEAKRAAETLAASSGVVDEYKSRIVAKIKRFVNKQVCGTGRPELVFTIALMPTGEVSGNPRLVKGSGLSACDQAVERAILQAQPLPLPPQPELFAQFRDLNLKFRPNDDQ